ncbi:MAG: EF-P lysine aminoacylase EpmA [Pirellulales bacterium]
MEIPRTTHDFAPGASLVVIEQRSLLLRKLRDFFYARKFIEVETPLLASEIIPEMHIEPITGATTAAAAVPGSPENARQKTSWLQASPELHMKRLLAAGATAIFQITRSFRAGEQGPLHNREFTLVEWYRVGDNLQGGIDLLDQLSQALLDAMPAGRTTYAEAFQRALNLCPHTATIEELAAAAAASHIAVPGGMNRDEWLNLLLATRVETELGRDRPEIVYHYPASQASLAKIVPTEAGYDVAERFELYYRGVELANGYHELTDAAEQRRRFIAVNAARVADGRRALPLPESLLAALEHGLPDCTGVALGFDRLVMLAAGAATIGKVMTFPSSRDTVK